jgi:hypothetical protein
MYSETHSIRAREPRIFGPRTHQAGAEQQAGDHQHERGGDLPAHQGHSATRPPALRGRATVAERAALDRAAVAAYHRLLITALNA